MKTSATASSGDVVEVDVKPHHKDIARVRAELASQGIAWDGWVTDEYGNRHWVDEETVRGNYPSDCPRWLRHRIGQMANSLGNVDAGVKIEVAIWARGRGYKVSDSELQRLLANGPLAYREERGGKHRTARMLDALDTSELDLYLRERVDPETTSYIRYAVARGIPLTGFFNQSGRLVGVSGVVAAGRGGVRVEDGLETASVPYDASNVLYERERVSRQKWFGAGERCMYCNMERELCLCPVGNDARRKDLSFYKDRTPTHDYYWGEEHSVAATPQMREVAETVASDLSRWGWEVDGGTSRRLEELGGSKVWENIALYFEQTRVLPGERQELLTTAMSDIATLLQATDDRAWAVHRDYVRTLWAEFDAPRAVLGGEGIQEIFLGRDGIYPYIARGRVLEEYAERNIGLGEMREMRCVSISRRAVLGERHRELLGQRSVIIDTGYYGSIPLRMAEAQGLQVEDFQHAKALEPGKVAIRLMTTEKEDSFGFAWQTPRPHTDLVEDDAKPTRSARYVGDRAPTGAVEQLVYRQLEHSIREIAGVQIKAILDGQRDGTLDLTDPLFGHAKPGPNSWLKKDLYTTPQPSVQ